MQPVLPHINTVHQHLSLRRVIKARDQLDQRGLSAPGLPHNRNGLSRLGRKADMMQHRAVLVGKADIPELNPSAQTRRWCIRRISRGFPGLACFRRYGYIRRHSRLNRMQRIHDRRLGVIDLHHFFRCCRKALKLVHNTAQIAHRVGKRPGETGKSHILPHRKLVVNQENTADKEQYDRQKICKSFHIRIKVQPDKRRFLIRFRILPVTLIKFFLLILFPGKCLDHAVAGNILLGRRIHQRQFFAQQSMHRRHAVAEAYNDNENKRSNRQQRKRQPPVHIEKIHRCREHQRKTLDNHAQHPGDHVAHRVQVARQTRHQIARAVIIIKFHVLVLNFRKQKIADAIQHPLRNMLKIDAGRIYDDSAQKRHQHHPHDQPDQQISSGGQIFCRLIAGQEEIHNLFRKNRHRQLQDIVKDRAENAQHIHGAIPLHILPQPLHF